MDATFRIARSALDHIREHGPAEVGERAAIEVDHLTEPLRIRPVEPPAQAEAGVVHEQVDLFARGADIREQLGCGTGSAEVDLQRPRIAQLGGKRVEPALPSCDKHQPMAALRQLAREIGAQAGGRAGDDRDLTHSTDTSLRGV